jgi:hypothetical protein
MYNKKECMQKFSLFSEYRTSRMFYSIVQLYPVQISKYASDAKYTKINGFQINFV